MASVFRDITKDVCKGIDATLQADYGFKPIQAGRKMSTQKALTNSRQLFISFELIDLGVHATILTFINLFDKTLIDAAQCDSTVTDPVRKSAFLSNNIFWIVGKSAEAGIELKPENRSEERARRLLKTLRPAIETYEAWCTTDQTLFDSLSNESMAGRIDFLIERRTRAVVSLGMKLGKQLDALRFLADRGVAALPATPAGHLVADRIRSFMTKVSECYFGV